MWGAEYVSGEWLSCQHDRYADPARRPHRQLGPYSTAPGIVLKKERLQAVVDLLPDVFTLDQLVNRLELLHRVDTGIAAIERGEGVPHEVVMARLQARVEAAKAE